MATKIQLNTLKDCFKFLEWLYKGDGKDRLKEVSQNLHSRIKNHFSSTFLKEGYVEQGLSPFLEKASRIYGRLSKDPQPGDYGGKNATEIVDALLDCHPKFFAAMYFLQYCVNNTFGTLGGGGWEKNYPGYENKPWLGRNDWGGDLQEYLRSVKPEDYGGIIPGGCGFEEVRYGHWDSAGYSQGTKMYLDLQEILKRDIYNFFRSVFVSSAVAYSGVNKENTANALSLVRTFCDIVKNEPSSDGGDLLKKLNADLQKYNPPKSICWKDLREHCAQLRNQIDKIFKHYRFDFTGQVTKVSDLNEIELAGKTADWLRGNVVKVRGHLNKIEEYKTGQHFGEYFTKNLFPYGFAFSDKSRSISSTEVRNLMSDLYNVSKQLSENRLHLDRLKDILDGNYRNSCPPASPSKKPEAPPAKPVVTKAEATKPTATKNEGTSNQGKKAEGAQNQGEKAEGTPNQSNGQSGDVSSGPPVLKSAPDLPPVGGGDSGPKGASGAVVKGSSVTVTPAVSTDSTSRLCSIPNSPPPAFLPGGAASSGQPGVGGQGSPAGVTPAPQHPPPQVPAPPQPPGVSGSGSGTTGGQVVTLQTSQDAVHSSSSGANTSGTTAAGVGRGIHVELSYTKGTIHCDTRPVLTL
ncbi:ribosome binding protein, putative [Babesia ovata]|uniref:Ribosome binding protein, putative n=1 Tax=Babesia ovata TaxID=189622 RepID=A0A2H6KDM4_9APIC|nr:ribosome binding protein, putative [Babesia ovata]GBE61091.1 ribosome binding protein, putative [Babesia ovata]